MADRLDSLFDQVTGHGRTITADGLQSLRREAIRDGKLSAHDAAVLDKAVDLDNREHPGREVTGDDIREVLPSVPVRLAEPAALPNAGLLDASLTDTLDDYERMLITRALSVAGGNIAEAARRLQTDRPNLYRRMKRLGIVESDRGERAESRA